MGYLDPHRRRRQGGGATGSVGRASSSAGRAALSHLPGVAEGADAAASQRALLLPSRTIAADLDGDLDLDQVVAQLTRATELATELDRRIKATTLRVEELAPALLAIAADPETGEILS